MFSEFDARHMARALQLARQGLLTTRPNPRVGCVIVNNGEVVGEGYHIQAGGPHAEVHALRAAGDKAKNATVYVTLEPCSHFGKTPPCAQALVDAGVGRVIAAMVDPNPKVAGRGLEQLKQAGIPVEHGLMRAEAEAVNPGFIKRMQTGLPYIRIKLASSLDGKTALANGESKWITGSEARQDVQRLRARSDAIITGADSVMMDGARMNVRYSELGHWQQRISEEQLMQPLRVVVDGQARLTPDLPLFACDGEVLLAHLQSYKCDWPDSVSCWQSAESESGKVDLDSLLAQLAEREVNEVLVESGAALAGAFFRAGLWDELVVYQAPKLMGDTSRDLLQLPELSSMAEVTDLQYSDVRQLGADLRLILKRH